MTYEIRMCNLTKFGNYAKSYAPILVDTLILDDEVKERLEFGASRKCIIHIFRDNTDISQKYIESLGTTTQQAIYNQIKLRVWMRGTGPNNWRITQKKLEDEGINYTFYTVGD